VRGRPTGAEVDAGCADAARTAAACWRRRATTSARPPPALFEPDLFAGARVVLAVAAAQALDEWAARTGVAIGEGDVEPTTWAAATTGRAVTGPELVGWMGRLQQLARAITGWWVAEGIDVFVTPTTAAPPTLLGDYRRGYESGRGSAFTSAFNVTGQPALSLPLGWPDDGLPRRAQLIAPLGREGRARPRRRAARAGRPLVDRPAAPADRAAGAVALDPSRSGREIAPPRAIS
jgi:amidase